MEKKIFKEIPYDIDINKLIETLQLRNNKRILKKTENLIERAKKVAKPKAIYIEAQIENRSEDAIVINGITFHSRMLRSNTNHVNTLFPYVITCGTEIERISHEVDNMMGKYILDGIKTKILMSSTAFVSQHIKNNYQYQDVTYNIPGSLEEWDMKEQKKLFQLVGDVTELIGVRLSESYTMYPGKSVSGIYYAAPESR